MGKLVKEALEHIENLRLMKPKLSRLAKKLGVKKQVKRKSTRRKK